MFRRLLLLGLLSAVVAIQPSSCAIRAWVRAPNLAPGQIVRGDVRVKLDGPCDDVSQYNLGLRFAERSWVKTRREEVTLPKRPDADRPWANTKFTNSSVYEPMDCWPFCPSVNSPALEKYEKEISDPSLWLAREEERTGFETTFILPFDTGTGTSQDLVRPFAILVPFTNYPPAYYAGGIRVLNTETDVADSEHTYSYFVNVTFSNGTQQQIEAGYTSFDALTTSQSSHPETFEAAASREWFRTKRQDEIPAVTVKDEFTLLVNFPQGRHFEQGSTINITIASRQVGPGLQLPQSISYVSTRVTRERKWAAKFAADNDTAETLLRSGTNHESQLLPTHNDSFRGWYDRDKRASPPTFSQSGVIENGTVYTTEEVPLQFKIASRCYPSFQMHYETAGVELIIQLQIRNISLEDAPGPGRGLDADLDDDVYDWVPRLREEYQDYRGVEILRATIPIFVFPKYGYSENSHQIHAPVHYLSPEARSPIFIDPSSALELITKTVEERDALAPISKAEYLSHEGKDVAKHRYCNGFCGSSHRPRRHYVGDTWLRKVMSKDAKFTMEEGRLIVQG